MEQVKLIILPLLIGYILDLMLGDPKTLPHPIVGFGKLIAFFTVILNRGKLQFLKGGLMCFTLSLGIFFLFDVLQKMLLQIHNFADVLFTSIFVFYGLANKTLLNEGMSVVKYLKNNKIETARKKLSEIVGRDTSHLSAQKIRLAVLESLSENLSDGVIAPLFYYGIGGIPGMMCYKMINTMDSMIAYKNERYMLFGRFAARLDDVANFIPARITALLMILLTCNLRGLQFIVKYRKAHASPNSAYPEAALAGILNCRFGGTNFYNGVEINKPYIGENNREITDEDMKKVKYINHTVCLAAVFIIIFAYLPWQKMMSFFYS